MKNIARTALVIIVAGVLVAGGAILGHFTAAEHAPAAAEAKPSMCNLRMPLDTTNGAEHAIYVAPDLADRSLVQRYGHIANQSCTDAQLTDWIDQRRKEHAAVDVCRPVLRTDDVTGYVYPIGCAVPELVVSDGPR